MTGAEFAFYYSLMVTTADDLPDIADVIERPAWHGQAGCRDVDVTVFFPARGESTWTAKAVCGTCPVAEPCRDYALSRTDVHGVWGGTSHRQRSVLRMGEAEPARGVSVARASARPLLFAEATRTPELLHGTGTVLPKSSRLMSSSSMSWCRPRRSVESSEVPAARGRGKWPGRLDTG